MQTKKQANKYGFTIVELLIVIVVIGILAALVLNSFANVQAQARNSQRISAAQAYYKILMAYKVQYGSYPDSGVSVCLGENYDNWAGGPEGDCKILDGSAGNLSSVDAATNAELKKVAPTLPEFNTSVVTAFGDTRRGLVYEQDMARTYDGKNPYVLMYWLEMPQQDCGLTAFTRGGATSIYEVSTTGYSATSATATTCFVLLPHDA